jgi:gas vesicle protein
MSQIKDFQGNKRRLLTMAENNSRGDNRLMFLLVGSAIGAAVGVLVAPKSGKETREQIRVKIKEQTDALQTDVKSAQEQLAKGAGLCRCRH